MLNCSTYFSVSKIDSIIKKRDKTSTFEEKSLYAAAKAFIIFQPQRDAEDSSLMPD